jgi:hypothetical protein
MTVISGVAPTRLAIFVPATEFVKYPPNELDFTNVPKKLKSPPVAGAWFGQTEPFTGEAGAFAASM